MKTPLLAVILAAFSTAVSTEPLRAQGSPEQLTKAEVEQIIAQAATHAMWVNPGAIIAVTDQEGFVLGVWDVQGRIPSPLPAFAVDSPSALRSYGLLAGAITRAATAAFLSSDEEALTTRTAGYITQQHFPPGVANTPPGPLVGVGFSNLFFSDINRIKQIANPLLPSVPFDPADLRASLTPGDLKRISPGVRCNPVLPGSLNDSPGGVPLYKNGHLVGAIGVTGDGTPTNLAPAAAIILNEVQLYATTGYVPSTQADADEFVALAGQTGFRPSPAIVATNILINGIRIPYVYQPVETIADISNVLPLSSLAGRMVDGFPIQAPPPPYPYPVVDLGGVVGELRGPVVANSAADPGGVIRFIDDPLSSVPGRNLIGGAQRLNAYEVQSIITKAAHRASITRAGIRLPLGTSAKVFITVVNNPDRDTEPATVLGTFRVGEATMFSWDVAIQKARTAVFSSNRQLAMSTRSVGFLSQSNYPPGIDGTPFGPFFGFQEAVSLKRRAGTNPSDNVFPGNPNLPNGLTIFPGGFPLYRNGELIGAIGVSGDGVDQDDIISASGCEDFLAAYSIRADSYAYKGFRLPYAKFPRNPVISGTSVAASPPPAKNSRDFDRDGNTDLVFQNTVGQIAVWHMDGNGGTLTTGILSASALGDWKIVGITDVNGDGNPDLVFQNTIGQIAAWYLDGSGAVSSSGFLYSGGLGDWRIVGIADMNDDGKADLVFQNTAGQICVWYLNGSGGFSGSGWIYTGTLGDWKVVGVADLNGDGIADLILQNSIGQISAWFLDQTGGFISWGTIYGGGLGDWRVTGVADMNGDGNADLIFQNGIGQIAVWYLDGSGSTVNFLSGTGAKVGSKLIYSGGLGDWRLR